MRRRRRELVEDAVLVRVAIEPVDVGEGIHVGRHELLLGREDHPTASRADGGPVAVVDPVDADVRGVGQVGPNDRVDAAPLRDPALGPAVEDEAIRDGERLVVHRGAGVGEQVAQLIERRSTVARYPVDAQVGVEVVAVAVQARLAGAPETIVLVCFGLQERYDRGRRVGRAGRSRFRRDRSTGIGPVVRPHAREARRAARSDSHVGARILVPDRDDERVFVVVVAVEVGSLPQLRAAQDKRWGGDDLAIGLHRVERDRGVLARLYKERADVFVLATRRCQCAARPRGWRSRCREVEQRRPALLSVRSVALRVRHADRRRRGLREPVVADRLPAELPRLAVVVLGTRHWRVGQRAGDRIAHPTLPEVRAAAQDSQGSALGVYCAEYSEVPGGVVRAQKRREQVSLPRERLQELRPGQIERAAPGRCLRCLTVEVGDTRLRAEEPRNRHCVGDRDLVVVHRDQNVPFVVHGEPHGRGARGVDALLTLDLRESAVAHVRIPVLGRKRDEVREQGVWCGPAGPVLAVEEDVDTGPNLLRAVPGPHTPG